MIFHIFLHNFFQKYLYNFYIFNYIQNIFKKFLITINTIIIIITINSIFVIKNQI